MGKRILIMIAVFSLSISLLTGCGKNIENPNITEGMDKILQLDYNGALASFEAARAAGENERLICRGVGLAYMGLTDYGQAIENFNACLQLSDGMVQNIDFDVNYYLAAAYYKNGDAGSAQRTYDAILNLRPEESDAYYLRGTARLVLGEYEKAQEDFDRVLALTNGDCDRLISIYQALEENGYREIGRQYLQTAISENGERMKAYDKGRIYYYLEDYQQACNFLEESRDTGTAESYLFLGKAYEATGDYNYASSVYNSYIAKDTTNAAVYNQLGLCRMKQGEYQQALETFQTAMNIENNGMLQTLQFNEIVAYEYLGDFQRAAVLMNNYVSTYPDDTKAQREYEFLKTR